MELCRVSDASERDAGERDAGPDAIDPPARDVTVRICDANHEGGEDRLDANMQRVRIGFTGLAFVFLLVLLAAVFTGATDEQPITANGIEAASDGGSGGSDKEVSEPLAELGVAPGNAPEADNAVTNDTVAVEDPLRPQRRR